MGSKNPDAVYNPNQVKKDRTFKSVNNTQNSSMNSKFLPEKKHPPARLNSVTQNNAQKNKRKSISCIKKDEFHYENSVYVDRRCVFFFSTLNSHRYLTLVGNSRSQHHKMIRVRNSFHKIITHSKRDILKKELSSIV